MKCINKIKRNQKSVQSVHPCKSVIQTAYDIIKAHGGEIKVETKVDIGNPDIFGKADTTEFIILLPYKATK